MVSDAVVEKSAGHVFVGVLAIVVANAVGAAAVGGSVAGAGAIGLLLFPLFLAVGLYFGLRRIVLGIAVLADGLLDARFGTVASSSALDPRRPFEIPLEPRPDTDAGTTDGDGRDDAGRDDEDGGSAGSGDDGVGDADRDDGVGDADRDDGVGDADRDDGDEGGRTSSR
jgi:hypothetical protein